MQTCKNMPTITEENLRQQKPYLNYRHLQYSKACLDEGKTTNALVKLQWESWINVTAMTRWNISYHKTVKQNVTDYILKQAKGSEGQKFVPDRLSKTLEKVYVMMQKGSLKEKLYLLEEFTLQEHNVR